MKEKMLTVRMGKRTADIPEMWLVGATHHGCSVRDAIAHWFEQEDMAREFEAQRDAEVA